MTAILPCPGGRLPSSEVVLVLILPIRLQVGRMLAAERQLAGDRENPAGPSGVAEPS